MNSKYIVKCSIEIIVNFQGQKGHILPISNYQKLNSSTCLFQRQEDTVCKILFFDIF